MRPFKPISAGGQFSASEYNRLRDVVELLAGMTAEYPIDLSKTSYGYTFRFVDPTIWAVILGSSSSSSSSSCVVGPTAYGWREVQPTGDGRWSILDNGRSGSTGTNPAYQANGQCTDAGTVVRLRPGLDSEYLFEACCQAGPNVLSSSSSSTSSVSSESSSESGSSVSSESSLPSVSSVSVSSLPSSTSCACFGLAVQLVSDVQCVDGQLQQTKIQMCLPDCVTVC